MKWNVCCYAFTQNSLYTALEDAVKPGNFQRVVQAVRKVSGFNEEKHLYETPGLALKLGHTLNKICDSIQCRALMAEDEELIWSTEMFKKLYTSKWSELVSHIALNTLRDAKYNKPSTLPLTEDVQILHQYLLKSAENALFNFNEVATPQNYAQLPQVTLVQIIGFNCRPAGEVSKDGSQKFSPKRQHKTPRRCFHGLVKGWTEAVRLFQQNQNYGIKGQKGYSSPNTKCGGCTLTLD